MRLRAGKRPPQAPEEQANGAGRSQSAGSAAAGGDTGEAGEAGDAGVWTAFSRQLSPMHGQDGSMFGHMFNRQTSDASLQPPSLADLRRRALTLIDVVTERQESGPLRPHRLLAAIAVACIYWYSGVQGRMWCLRMWCLDKNNTSIIRFDTNSLIHNT